MLLLFRADRTRQAGTLPSHGADEQIHVCFLVSPADYEAWKRRIQSHKIAMQREVGLAPGTLVLFPRPRQATSFELADADIWPE